MVAAIKRTTRAVALGSTAVGGLSGAHLLLLLGAAALGRDNRAPQPSDELTLAVVVPAHDEEHQIAATIGALQTTAYPPARRRIVVVADNCSDATAQIARAAGAEVLERQDPARRGKGHALAWAFPRILEDARIDAVCIVDADCEVSANLLRALSGRLRAGADAVQARYVVSDPTASSGAALRWAGFALFNVLRPRGRDRLGVSAGLLGTGAAFSRALLTRSPWRAFSFAEDREQHMRWVLDGERVAFADEAEVRAPAAAGAASRPFGVRRRIGARAPTAVAAAGDQRCRCRGLVAGREPHGQTRRHREPRVTGCLRRARAGGAESAGRRVARIRPAAVVRRSAPVGTGERRDRPRTHRVGAHAASLGSGNRWER